jgi:hypothetical protein
MPARLAITFLLLSAVGALADPIVLAPDRAKPPFSIGKETTAITSPLNADGTVDYIGAINQRVGSGVAPDQNGWVLWVQVSGKEDLPQKTRDTMYQMAAGTTIPEAGPFLQSAAVWFTTDRQIAPNPAAALADKIDDLRLHLWTAKDAPEIADYLAAQQKPLDLAIQAAMRPKWWMPFISVDGRCAFGIILPGLSSMRQAANDLCARATLRAAAGDFNGFLADVTAVKHLARHVAPQATITALFAFVIDQAADHAIAAAALSGNLSASQVAQLRVLIDADGLLDDLPKTLDIEERWGALDIAALLATGQLFHLPAGHQFVTPFAGIDPARVDWDALLRRINADIDEDLRILKIPDLDQQAAAWNARDKQFKDALPSPPPHDAAPKPGESRDAYTARITALFEGNVLPAFTRVGALRQRERLTNDLTRTLLAAAAFKARTTHWPDQLEDLVPTDLPTLPRDFHNHPPAYSLTKNGPSLTTTADIPLAFGATK